MDGAAGQADENARTWSSVVRNRFWHYYPLEDADVSVINTHAVIALDANSLLHAYRLTPSASEAWLSYLEALDDRIWVPHRAAFEYQRNRVDVVARQNRLASEVEKDVQKALRSLRTDVTRRQGDIKRSRVFEWTEIDDALAHAGDSIRALVERARQAALDLDAAASASDPIHLRLTALLEGKVGDPPEEGWIEDAVAEGKKRFQDCVPPGWQDKDKEAVPGDEHRRFGDYFVWKQLLEYATKHERPAVLVSEDRKRDWIRTEGGRTMGPLPQLREEFRSHVNQPFWLYSVAGLMGIADSFGVKLDAAALHSAQQLEEESSDQRPKDAAEERVSALVQSLERFADHAAVGDGDLRREITELLAGLLADELGALEKPLRGPGAGIDDPAAP